MDKIIGTIAQVIFKIDTILYRTLGVVSPLRRQSWSRQGRRLQRKLDREHSLRDYLNARYSTSYTTKQALALED